MEKYNKHIAKNPNFEFVHVSLDRDEDSAVQWAAKESFPWLTIPPAMVDQSTMKTYKTTRSVPEYHLIDSDGNTIVAGTHVGDAAFAKLAELAKEDSK